MANANFDSDNPANIGRADLVLTDRREFPDDDGWRVQVDHCQECGDAHLLLWSWDLYYRNAAAVRAEDESDRFIYQCPHHQTPRYVLNASKEAE